MVQLGFDFIEEGALKRSKKNPQSQVDIGNFRPPVIPRSKPQPAEVRGTS